MAEGATIVEVRFADEALEALRDLLVAMEEIDRRLTAVEDRLDAGGRL